jgi:hypothetical protein
VPPIVPIANKLARAQARFIDAAEAIGDEQWNVRPSAGAWSAAEIAAHLVMIESAIIANAARITQKMPRPVPFLKRLHFPLWLVETRDIKRKTPIPLDSNFVGNAKETMLDELRAVRQRSLAFLDETKNRDLSAYCWPHPFLGMLNLYEWFEMIAAHQVRHTKQAREVSARLPKVVGTSQS